ncbi:hypothetical protein ACOJQI_12105 [Bacillus salacetis]|uniref:hypothetical protein n=1 Tax=Bacillus salacetis TaxID=2315464 RepID=UPI003BA0EF67
MEINDFDDARLVGFLSGNNPSYIEFNKNEKGNYVWKHIETHQDESFSIFLTIMRNSKLMFVTNSDNEIAKMQVDINGTTIEQSFTPYQATVSYVDLPQTKSNSYDYRNYKFFDINGELIRDE